MANRVVITGLGVISPFGTGVKELWEALKAGWSGIAGVTRFPTDRYATRIAGEVRGFDPALYLDRKEIKRMDRFTQFAVAGAKLAVQDAGLDLESEDPHRVGVIFGSGIGGMETFEEQARVLVEKGPGRVSPFFVPMMIANMAAGQVSIALGARGINHTIVNACATATNAIGEACYALQRGDADAVITGGAEASVTPLSLAGFCAMKALSTRNEDPERASRPFDRDRDGFVLGEGAGVLVLETLEHALGRDAHIYAEVVGFGCTADAYHITAPLPDATGSAEAMRRALVTAKLNPEEVSYINAHGTSTELNDKLETLAIKHVFGDHAYQIPVSSTKSMTGHLLGAAGGLEAIACAMAIADNVIPPTINYETPDPECDLDYVPNQAREYAVETALSNSFGFGGHNATLVLKRFRG